MDHKAELQNLIEGIERAAYERGWRDHAAAIARLEVPPLTPPGQTASQPSSTAAPRQRARKGATADAIRNVLAAVPGLKGATVVREVQSMVPNTAERTVRTVLRRMRLDGEIEQRGGEWYLAKQVPFTFDGPNPNAKGEASM